MLHLAEHHLERSRSLAQHQRNSVAHGNRNGRNQGRQTASVISVGPQGDVMKSDTDDGDDGDGDRKKWDWMSRVANEG